MKRVLLFVGVNLLVVLTLSLVVGVLGLSPRIHSYGYDLRQLLGFCAVFGFGGALISLAISRWTAKFALGVELVDPSHPRGSAESTLVEKVRILSSRAGITTLPEIGIYASPEVNAFATGPTKNRALVAVSTGLLERMDEAAIEGVLGHELSHVANGDMVTMTLLQGVANTFVMFFARVAAFAIDQALRGRDGDRKGGLGPFAYYLLVMVLEVVFMILASIVVHGFSRWREFRADAGGADLAGREKMIHALEALKRSAELVDDRHAALATMKINSRGGGLLARLFSTHPQLEARIAALKALP
ncbi:MAG TPA: protease HtpX [Elusimicrobia bacterium]|nr:protease HtpX [Elusimicrobiota bacterium]